MAASSTEPDVESAAPASEALTVPEATDTAPADTAPASTAHAELTPRSLAAALAALDSKLEAGAARRTHA